jgi:hypothetical protein
MVAVGEAMRAPISLFAVSVSVSFLLSSSAGATAATSADLSGKKFCWNDGGTEDYRADGKYSSTHDGEGTWEVTQKGVQISTNQISGLADMQKLSDGTFTATWLVNGKPKTWTGRHCE